MTAFLKSLIRTFAPRWYSFPKLKAVLYQVWSEFTWDFRKSSNKKPPVCSPEVFSLQGPICPSGDIHPEHVHNLAVLDADRGVVGGEMIICDRSDQEVAGIIQVFSPVQIGSVVIQKICRSTDGSLTDFVPVFCVTVAAFVKHV